MHAALGGLQQRAQRRLLAEAALAEDSDASNVGTKREVPEGSEADGLGVQRAPCPSRDRARASLRRLHPTALCCAKPAAPAAATESEGLEPLSRPLQAAAPAGGGGGLAVCWYRKALPWAHLAAREQAAAAAAAAAEVSTNGSDGDGYEEVETGLGSQPAAQDWSWLAAPPWGVAPLPPELSCRVDWQGRLRPGAGGASSALAADATAAHSPAQPPPHPHPDLYCARLHAQLHRTAAAVQQVLAVAAAAASAGGDAGGGAPPGGWYVPDWQRNAGRLQDDGRRSFHVMSQDMQGMTLRAIERMSGGSGRPPFDSVQPPARGGRDIGAEAVAPAAQVDARVQQYLQDTLERAEQDARGRRQDQFVGCLAADAVAQEQAGPNMVMDVWRGGGGGGGGGVANVQRLLDLVVSYLRPARGSPAADGADGGGEGPEGSGEGGGGGGWRRLMPRVLRWSGAESRAAWRWLLESAAVGEGAEQDAGRRGLAAAPSTPEEAGTRASRPGDDTVPQAWSQAAAEVLCGATCFLGLCVSVMLVGTDAIMDIQRDCACHFDPLAMAVAWPTWLLARALHPDVPVSPLIVYDCLLLGQTPAFTPLPLPPGRPPATAVQRTPPPPPLSYQHCLAVIERCVSEPARTTAWMSFLVVGHNPSQRLELQNAVADAEVHQWYLEWQAAQFEQQLEEERQQAEELCLLQAWAAAGGSSGSSGGIGGGELGQSLPQAEAAAAAAAARAAARRLGLDGVLHAAAALRPGAAAIVACLRALMLLHISAGTLCMLPYLPDATKLLAIAGANEPVPAPGGAAGGDGGCDLVRLRLPLDPGQDANSAHVAALLLLLALPGLSEVPAVRDSTSVFAFQPELAAREGGGGGGGCEVSGGGGAAAPPPGPQRRQKQQRPELLLTVCRAFLPDGWVKPGTASPWPYPWLAVSEWGTSLVWGGETRTSAMVAWLRRALIEKRLGVCAAHAFGVDAANRLLAALMEVRAEMRQQGRDLLAKVPRYCLDEPALGEDAPQPPAPPPAAGPATGSLSGSGGSGSSGSSPAGDGTAAQPQQARQGPLRRAVQMVEEHVNDVAPLPLAAVTRHELQPQQLQPQQDAGAGSAPVVVVEAHTTSAAAQDMGPLLQLRPPALPGQGLPPVADAAAQACADAAYLELHVAALVAALQRKADGAEAAAKGKQLGGARRRQPWHDLRLDMWCFECVPGRPWELLPPSAADAAELDRKADKERVARELFKLSGF
ncbi:hypothetical protein HXX76_006386 [Chlamydomonas incerta]|uniref:Uncharacterized protein n=1 Tax=Chlamydomonas incerta TaxID=51695 RepID=A0A835TEP4_CHLIN|nr:hypothetical protein HXX76_006386 [Chlamydomonas incerta]|eukprot:KAG2436866.1 hypothetical protein HXX76_006386 [Chlamydomonas incerta]